MSPNTDSAVSEGHGLGGGERRISDQASLFYEEHLSERIELATLAHLVRQSPFHFCRMKVRSPQALPIESIDMPQSQSSACEADELHPWSQWLLLRLFKGSPVQTKLSGRELEYFILQLCSLDAGMRAAEIVFYLGGGQVSQGHYADTNMLFYVDKAVDPEVTRRDK